ncbi:MAG TPA: trypsin-like peptidase domain-containing protein [Candidatus Nanoarchaeia archaeon]|nr:trypsin-like peptidase domain-containing protein [Candidatus Nanoarchaeia archaeon]
MRKHLKRHLIYGSVLLLLILTFSSFEYYQTKQTTRALTTLQSSLGEQISTIGADVDDLEKDLAAAKSKISTLSTSLDEKETKINSLTGQLDQVRTESQQQLGELEENINNLKIQNQDFSSVIEDSIPAVVSIRTNLGSGSGFLVSSDGYIVTNYHVIKDATAATIITSDSDRHAVALVGASPNADVAVLKIDGTSFSFLEWGNSDKIIVGEKVIAVGNPGGFDFSVTQGIVSATKRFDSQGNEFVQIDVPINPGNSGGPLINAKGEVIGINTKKIAEFEGVGFAIASNQGEEIVESLIDDYEEQAAQQ